MIRGIRAVTLSTGSHFRNNAPFHALTLSMVSHFRRYVPFRAVAMSVIPSVLFLFSGIILLSVPLILGALVFAPCHILISIKDKM
ncbi:MAG: hypothetical protein J5993_04620 [Clostridia bacterium]|nr:hypothetical protein [Clostridia bacterium]